VFSFQSAADCSALLMDLRVVLSAKIKQVIFCPADSELISNLETLNRSGDHFVVITIDVNAVSDAVFVDRLRAELKLGRAPVVMLTGVDPDRASTLTLDAAVVSCAVQLGAKKIFFAGEVPGLTIDGVFKSYPTTQSVREAIDQGALLNMPVERIRLLIDQQEAHGLDIVLLEARRGVVFEEVFTHAGSGTLLTKEYPNILRPAVESDVRDIMAIMQPYIAEGSLRAMSEDELLQTIHSYMVYSVNGQIVCAAALRNYGDACELAKLCTLPRYQARGRARALVRALLEEAKKRGKSSVFALTVHAHVGEFFERLGFAPVQREDLPPDWKQKYDFSRPSKAYRYNFT
jgi:amino-acid N-acetyltransferase